MRANGRRNCAAEHNYSSYNCSRICYTCDSQLESFNLRCQLRECRRSLNYHLLEEVRGSRQERYRSQEGEERNHRMSAASRRRHI
jgi:hypothetical protein